MNWESTNRVLMNQTQPLIFFFLALGFSGFGFRCRVKKHGSMIQQRGGLGGTAPSLVQPGDKARIHIYHVITMAMGPHLSFVTWGAWDCVKVVTPISYSHEFSRAQAQTLRKCFKLLLSSFPLCFWECAKHTKLQRCKNEC